MTMIGIKSAEKKYCKYLVTLLINILLVHDQSLVHVIKFITVIANAMKQ